MAFDSFLSFYVCFREVFRTMLSDVIKRYGGEKMDPLDVYKDIFRIGEGFIQKEYEDSLSLIHI